MIGNAIQSTPTLTDLTDSTKSSKFDSSCRFSQPATLHQEMLGKLWRKDMEELDKVVMEDMGELSFSSRQHQRPRPSSSLIFLTQNPGNTKIEEAKVS